MSFRQLCEWRYTSVRSQPRRQKEVSGQHHAPGGLHLRGKEHQVSVECEAGWAAQTILDVRNSLHHAKCCTLFSYFYCTFLFNNENTSPNCMLLSKPSTRLDIVDIHVSMHLHFFFLLWRCDPTRVMTSSFLRFLDHTQRRTTVGRTPLDK